jgi:hypothetical protein
MKLKYCLQNKEDDNMSFIEELRALGSFDGEITGYSRRDYDERLDTVEELTDYNPRYSKRPYTVKLVEDNIEDHGRWSDYRTRVFKVEEDGEVAYFEYGCERPASEMQEGMDLSYHFQEVVAVPITTFKYVAKN